MISIKSMKCLNCPNMTKPLTKNEKNLARHGRAYCSEKCKKEFLSKLSSQTMTKTNLKNAKRLSERMQKNNPMWMPGIKEKMRQKMIGKPFLHRGGNGHMTSQQLSLWNALFLPIEYLEYPIKTKPIWEQMENLPSCYKADIGIPNYQIAIEINGKKHKL